VTHTAPPALESPFAMAERGGDAFIRQRGRDFLFALYGSLRSLKLYPPENAVVQKTLQDLQTLGEHVYRREQELEVRASREFIFLNSTRLRLDLENYASFSRILAIFREGGIGMFRLVGEAGTREWTVLLSLIQSAPRGSSGDRSVEIMERLADAGVEVFVVGPPVEGEEDRERSKEASKRVYAHSVSATKDVIASVRMGQSPNLKKIKRVVQGIVDQILNEETSLLGLTTLRDYDEYTFVHSVNVCIFSVALGRKLGFNRRQLYDLGVAALMHDIGKSRIPLEVLAKPSSLDEEEWKVIQKHPWFGVLTLLGMRGHTEFPYRAMIVAYEHHMKTDLTGYPRPVRPRTMSIFSRIVAIADGFDAATSRRVYQKEPYSPADALAEMCSNPHRGMDPVLVKAFVSMVGHYPVGTLVILDTFELALVHAANPLPEAISRPTVRVISDAAGNVLYPGDLVDLTERDGQGSFTRTIIKLADPNRYGIRVSDYYI
jgi:HD-GYP domain-containing protein (c-di-GMP phosphodiesterase class II)